MQLTIQESKVISPESPMDTASLYTVASEGHINVWKKYIVF